MLVYIYNIRVLAASSKWIPPCMIDCSDLFAVAWNEMIFMDTLPYKFAEVSFALSLRIDCLNAAHSVNPSIRLLIIVSGIEHTKILGGLRSLIEATEVAVVVILLVSLEWMVVLLQLVLQLDYLLQKESNLILHLPLCLLFELVDPVIAHLELLNLFPVTWKLLEQMLVLLPQNVDFLFWSIVHLVIRKVLLIIGISLNLDYVDVFICTTLPGI